MVESVVQSHAEIVVGSAEKLIRVLHVDDELGLLKVAKQCLELQGPFQVDTAGSVEEALSKLKEKEYDAIVSDYKMPGKDGLEFLKELRAKGNDIPFILFTGKGREEVIIKALNLGADHYVNKNGDPEAVYTELKHLISEIVGSRKAESELQESQMRYRNLIENAPDVVYTISENGTLASLNSAFERLTGWKCSEWIGKSFASLIHPDDLNTAMETFEKTLHGERLLPYELRVRSKSGKYLIGEFTSTPWFEKGKIVGELGIVREVTGPKKTEETLRASEEKHRVISGITADFVFSCLKKGEGSFAINWMAGATEKIFGHSTKQIEDKGCWRFLVHPQDLSTFDEKVTGLKPGQSSVCELRINHKDGSTRWIKVSSKVVEDVNDPANHRLFGGCEDVTERKTTEDALRESEEKWRSLAENAPNIIVIVDRVGTIQFINRTVVNARPEEIVGRSVYDFIDPEHHNVVKKTIEQVFQTGEGGRYGISGVGPKGSVAWYETHAGPIKRNGQVASVTLITTDFTERKKAEASLLLHETRLKSMLDLNRMTEASEKQIMDFALEEISKITQSQFAFIGLLNSDATVMTIHSWSKTAMKDCAVISKPMHFPVSEAGVWAEPIRQKKPVFINDYSAPIPSKRGCPEGHVPITRFLGIPVFDGEHAVAIAAVANKKEDYDEPDSRNLTAMLTDMWTLIKRKRTEEALRESMEGYRELAESISDMFFAMDKDFRYTYWNKASEEFTGISAKDAIGKSLTEVFPDVRGTGVEQFYKKALRTRQPQSYLNEYQLRGKDYVFEINAYPTKAGLSVFAKDVTERKKVEQQLRIKETAVASSVNGAAFADLEGKLTYVNSSFLEMWGYANENEVLGRPAEDFWSSRENAVEVVKALGHKGGWVGDLMAKKKDGSTFEVQLSASMVKDETGKPSCMMASFSDVTERRKAGQSLKESEEKYRGLVELAPDGIVAVNTEGIVTSVNRSFLKLVGYDSEEGIVGKPFTELMTVRTEDVPRFQGMFMSLMNGESPSPSEVLYVRRDGTSRWAEVHPGLMIKDGCPVGVQAIVRDVSERKNAEKLVQESHQKFEGLFRHNPEAAVYLDVNFKIVAVNPRFCQLFGYSAEEVKGRNINEVVAPEDMREEAESLDKDAKNGYASHDTVRKRKDGSFVPVSISACPVTFENNLLGYVGIYKDITELKRMQEEAEESKKHFQMLFDLMADPVAVVDGRGKILEVTRKVEEITGFKKEELVGENLLKVKMFGAKTKATMIKSLAKRMMGMHLEPYEVEVLKKDGGKLMYEINAAKIDYKGKPADLVVFRDIMERKKLEEKLRIVGSLTRHDVRNKLSAITGNIYINKKKLADRPDVLEGFNDMQAACEQIVRIFEFAKDYERLGIEELRFVDVETTVGKAASSFSDLKGARIVNDCRGLTVLADSLLERLFYNLIDNSLKYGGKLTQIRIRHEESQNQLRLIYEDDGVGIPKDIKAKLFNEGFTTGKGSGYGLYLIKRMIEVYGWTISETGTHGKGAQFTIDIPKTKPDGRPNYKLS